MGERRALMAIKMHDKINSIICNDTLTELKTWPNECVDMVLTSPPYYGLRDYGIDGQLGLEPTPEEYIAKLREIMLEIKRVLKKHGTVWWNMGDTYGGTGFHRQDAKQDHDKLIRGRRETFPEIDRSKMMPKCLLMMPERFAFMMLDIGFILRNKIIWHKPNPMPSSVKDRFTTTWEYVYLFSKSKKYFFDLDAVRKPHKALNRWGGPIMKVPIKSKAQKSVYAVQYRTRHMQPNPLGKNPGDVMIGKEQFYAESRPINVRRDRIPGVGLRDPNRAHQFHHKLGKNPGDFWSITTQPFKGAHFAVFPEKLCEAPIKAGCPKAICNKCGKPRVRIIKPSEEYAKYLSTYEKERIVDMKNIGNLLKEHRLKKGLSKNDIDKLLGTNTQYSWWEGRKKGYEVPTPEMWIKLKKILEFDDRYDNMILNPKYIEKGKRKGFTLGADNNAIKSQGLMAKRGIKVPSINSSYQTIGFTKCDCNAGFSPGIVLDPFCGAGTALLVARKLRRNYIGIDIKPEYCEMASKRLSKIPKRLDKFIAA